MLDRKIILAVRIDENLHHKAKCQAYKDGKTLQAWVEEIIDTKLKRLKKDRKWLCQLCAEWQLNGTQVSFLKNCERCGKETACFPCEEE